MDNTVLLIANIITLVGMTIATVAALFNSKRRVLLFQSVNHVLEIIAQFMTKAYSGMVQEIITLVYSVTILFVKSTKKAPKIIISAICLVAGLVLGVIINVRFSGNVWYGYLPIAAAAIYTLFVLIAFFADKDALKGDLLLKIGLLINMSLWGVYGVFVKLYPIIVFNGVALVFATISLVRIVIALKRRKTQPVEAEAAEAPSDNAQTE